MIVFLPDGLPRMISATPKGTSRWRGEQWVWMSTFIAYSANSTVFIGARDLLWLFDATGRITIGAWPDAYWYSGFVAFLLFAGEVATGERFKRSYWLFLIPDAFYTGRGMWTGLKKALTILVGGIVGDGPVADALGIILGLLASAVLGYYVAKWGEVLLFGKRRQIRESRTITTREWYDLISRFKLDAIELALKF